MEKIIKNKLSISLIFILLILLFCIVNLNIINIYNVMLFITYLLFILYFFKKNNFIKDCLTMLILVVFLQAMVTDGDSFFSTVKYPLVSLFGYSNSFGMTDIRYLYNFFVWGTIVIIIKVMFLNRSKVANIILISFSFLISLINEYLIIFRGSAFSVKDMSGIKTALEVVGQYNFVITSKIACIFLFYVWCVIFICSKKSDNKIKNNKLLIFVSLVLGYLVVFSPIDTLLGIESYFWTVDGGFMTTTMVNFKYYDITIPDNYEEKIAYINQTYVSESALTNVIDSQPNIVVIMNESYVDLRLLSSEELFKDTEDPYILFDEICEESISGYAHVSVFGGTTANSEFEFLLGNTMAFRSDVPYSTSLSTALMSDVTQAGSLVTYFESLGYKSIAFHPYEISGWNREYVYNNLGFDEMYFINDLDYNTDDYLRSYISDEADYQTILELLIANEENPVFLFNVTMQNHGGYDSGYSFDNPITLDGVEGEYPKAEEYLSLVYESNLALVGFLEELKELEQETIVVFFGDHAPKLEDEFYEWITGEGFDNSNFNNYITSFFIWSNKQTFQGEISTSLNYLHLELIAALEYPKTAFQLMLEDVQSEFPIISSYLLIDSNGEVQNIDNSLETSLMLQLYEAASYNQIEYNGNLLEGFFDLK